MFDSLLCLSALRVATGDLEAALGNLNEALRNAQFMYENNKESLYSERCLAMAYQGLAEYHTHLTSRGPLARRSRHAIEAGQWYDKAASIWTRWRVQNLAIPFSTNHEREVLRARASLRPSKVNPALE